MAFNEKYEIPINPVKTFKHSFHGIANELGSVKVANCASCHTSHAVLPPSDPASSVNPQNIPRTCGKEGCHPGANVNYARGRFHVDPSRRDAGDRLLGGAFLQVSDLGDAGGTVRSHSPGFACKA
ncbi:MAG: hypothetical protein ACP5NF_06250 [Thermoanaerobaculum sp.]